jgi:Rieske 2Fe-2S family protein
MRAVTGPGGLDAALPRAAYVDESVHADERERLWARQWCAVGRSTDAAAPGAVLRVELAGESLLVIRQHDGSLRAFYNLCRHRGAQVVDTAGSPCTQVRALRCPYHSWTYGLDGALRSTPFLERIADEAAGALDLHPVGAAEWGGFVWVHLTPAAARPLAEQLGDVVARVARYPLAALHRGATITYDVAANWKVLAENYNECYHCGPVHPELCDLVPAFRRGGRTLDWTDGIAHRDGAWTFTTTGTTTRAPFPGLSEAERTRHKGELIYPNLWLSLAADHVAAFTLWPQAAGRTTVVMDLLFHPDAIVATDFDPGDATDFWDVVNRQDWAICESVQRGMTSRAFDRGWFAPVEDDSAAIGRWYHTWMPEP